jgi:NAD(P)-dependent dehydrogenase (short-subunit alcohol dehydrogenase family)
MGTEKKICLITGATSGIGKETALELARQGMKIIFNARDEEKGKKVRDEIISLSGNPDVNMHHCDLASFKSITEFAGWVKKNNEQLDILINNAGIWPYRKMTTVDGVEYTIAVNHLAPFLLTHLILDLILKSSAGRIINVSSGIHYRGYLDISDLEFKQSPFTSLKAYAQSKLANVLFTRELASRLNGSNVTVNCLAPGWVNTGLFRDTSSFVKFFARWMALTPAQGARTTIFLATSDKVQKITGEYFSKKKVRKAAKNSYDKDLMKKLWEISENYLRDYLSAICI